ncbi:MAG: hypothetical protein ACLFXM_14480, partial [Acidimicrobiia bacterium]
AGDDRYADSDRHTAGDRYGADDRYREGAGSDRYADRRAADRAARADVRDRRADSIDNGMYGSGSEPSRWPPPAEARRHESGTSEVRWAESVPSPDRAPGSERPSRVEQPRADQAGAERAPGVQQPPAAGRPPEVEEPMQVRPPGPPIAAHDRPPGPGRDPVTWRDEPPPAHATPREGAPPAPASSAPEPFAELDRAIAHAIAKALTEKLARYATTELLPLVAEEMVRVIGRRAGRGASAARPRHDPVPRDDPGG